MVGLGNPQALVFLREFVLGSNMTGLVGADQTVFGGEVATLAGNIIPGGSEVYYGSGTTASTSIAPATLQASWASFLATATLTSPIPAQTTPGGAAANSATNLGSWPGRIGILILTWSTIVILM